MLAPLPENEWTLSHAAHLLNRAGFGGTPEQIQGLHTLGLQGAVDYLLTVSAPPPPPPEWANEGTVQELADALQEERRNPTNQENRTRLRRLQAQRRLHLQAWWLERMVATPDPALEKLVLFWHGHFATSLNKVPNPWLMYLQNVTFREHALGGFEEMLLEIGRDPAMILWLDLQQSKGGKPNENYARELMELFTLGEGHYSEEDVLESARAFTGRRTRPVLGGYIFAKKAHDASTKTVLGKTGPLDGDAVVAAILDQPAAAIFLPEKIWRFYASESPPPGLVEEMGRRFRASDFQIRPLLRTLFASREFYAPDVIGTQIKSPIQWLVQMCRQLHSPLPPARIRLAALRELGQIPFAPPSVKGWDGGRAWITTHTLKRRLMLAENWTDPAAREGLELDPASLLPNPSPKTPEAQLESLATRFLSLPLPAAEQTRLLGRIAADSKDSTRSAVRALLASPLYQLT